VDFGSLFLVLDSSRGIPASLAAAKTDGIPVIAYGQLVNEVINFVIVALAVFVLVKQVNRIKKAAEAPAPAPAATTKDCPYCMTAIPIKATRCAHCTSQL
jgi:large conductance mechanosensitive channel